MKATRLFLCQNGGETDAIYPAGGDRGTTTNGEMYHDGTDNLSENREVRLNGHKRRSG